jgi:hypothetical protein
MPDTSPQIENIKREMERRSLDQIAVFNPTGNDRQTIWNGFVHRVPAGQEVIMPRYIAEKYSRETIDYLINQENIRRVDKENKKRVESGQKEMDAQEREVFDLRTNNPELRKTFLKEVYRGVTQEYGKEVSTMEKIEVSRTTDTDLIAEIDKQRQVKEVESIKIKPVNSPDERRKEDIESKMEAK